MKKLISLFAILLSIILTHKALAGDDAKQAIKSKLSALQSFTANFQQTVTDAEGEELQTAEGKIFLTQPQKLYWETLEPNEMQLIADGNTLWHVDPFVEQVIAIDQKHAAQNHPIMLLAQPDSELWSKYIVEAKSNSQYQLTSLDSDSDFVSLTIDFNDHKLTGLSILDKMEQRNTLVFAEILQNTDIDQQIFVFEMPEGYDLDDQR